MKIYVLEQGRWPEDNAVIGVYSTLDKAKAGVIGEPDGLWKIDDDQDEWRCGLKDGQLAYIAEYDVE